MDRLETLLKRLKQLDAEATQGPWEYSPGAGITAPIDHPQVELQELFDLPLSKEGRNNGELVAAYRNETPKLIAIIEEFIDSGCVDVGISDRFEAILKDDK
jgi:hypothetical protein